MSQAWSTYTDLTRIFIATALATGIATVFNLIFTQFWLAGFFGVIALVTGVVAVKKAKSEDHGRRGDSAREGTE